jgi:putative membrane protein
MSEDNKRDNQSLTRGIVAGAIGGLVASWIMNVFMEEAGPAVQHVAQHLDGTAHHEQPTDRSDESVSEKDEPKIDATMKTADAVFSTITGGRHLSFEGKQKGGPVVHYAFGAVMGALYGAAAEYAPVTRAGFGTVFASALFTGADLIAVPALNLSGSSAPAPISSLASPFSAHIVYGMATEAVRRLVRKAI